MTQMTWFHWDGKPPVLPLLTRHPARSGGKSSSNPPCQRTIEAHQRQRSFFIQGVCDEEKRRPLATSTKLHAGASSELVVVAVWPLVAVWPMLAVRVAAGSGVADASRVADASGVAAGSGVAAAPIGRYMININVLTRFPRGSYQEHASGIHT
ncbi:hypothetical protein NHX12_010144 [Muraenolepis orangiensis]|uniref:Uncharacterized protein n=1 Tax=Muraenolepis orangiensis TaxID=630683 RepID=A0A9Q0I850_9TELE|nr:hypothetical protein NHX12_010144 [Muraenolepis orangiensis]